MAAANTLAIIHQVIWNETFDMATVLDGLMVVTINGVTKMQYKHFYGKLQKFIQYIHAWGEAGVIKIWLLATPKVSDRGVPCMFVGYAKSHPGNTFQQYIPNVQSSNRWYP
jgi:hypothetical protein